VGKVALIACGEDASRFNRKPPSINPGLGSRFVTAVICVINPNQIPNPIPPTPPQQEAPPPLPPQQNPLPQPPDAPTPPSEQPNLSGTFTVEGFEFAGNTKFDSNTLADVIK
jgi:hypothetical protein